nr:hypothetical protein [uncultured archaeon]
MSHYTVLVLNDNPEEQLKPFDESLKIDFQDCTEEVNKSWEKDTISEWYADVDATITKEDFEILEKEGKLELKDFPPDPCHSYKFITGNRVRVNYEFPEEIWRNTEHARFSEDIYVKLINVIKDEESRPIKIIFASLEKIDSPKQISMKEKYGSFEKFLDEYHGYKKEEDGRMGYWNNEKATWDWYTLGGRWTGMLKLKEGATGKTGKPGLQTEKADAGCVDSARKCDIDFVEMSKKGLEESAITYDKFLEKYENDKECKSYHPYFEYGVKGEMEDKVFIPETKESYIKRHASFVTFAVLKNGEWFERGRMGWWGIASDEKSNEVWDNEFNKLISELPEETLLSVYDCHI